MTSPSIATLKDILDVLGVSLAIFSGRSPGAGGLSPQRPDHHLELHAGGVGWRSWCRTPRNWMMDPVLVTMGGGEEFAAQEPHEGEEFGIVLKGTVHLKLDNLTFKSKTA